MFTSFCHEAQVNDDIQMKQTPLAAKTALVIYERRNNYGESETYVAKHNINSRQEIQDGLFINNNEVNEILKTLTLEKKTNDTSLINENLLLDTFDHLIFFEPSHQRYPLWLSHRKAPKPYQITFPSLLYVVNKKTRCLNLYTLAFNRRPKLTDKLYSAPFPNISANGSVCQGTARLPEMLEAWNTEAISQSFLDAKKTHLNSSKLFRNGVTTQHKYEKYIRDKAKKHEKIKVSELAIYCTLDQLFSKLKG